ncbi:MAG: hypothetical protein AAGA28_15490, partial [Pseudomonadota bacterium]
GAGTALHGTLLIYDALHGQMRSIALEKDPACPVCGTQSVVRDENAQTSPATAQSVSRQT